MKNSFLFALLLILACACQPKENNLEIVELNQNWQFRQAGNEEWLAATVPGCVHADLRSHSLIKEEINGATEQSFQWIEKEDWEYRTEFNVTSRQLKFYHNELIFNGLDTYSEVYLNDVKVLDADNMFRTWSIDAKPYLKEGKNTLRVYFKSPVRIGMEKLKAYPYRLAVANELAPEGEQTNIFTRKAPFHFGWDWGPRLVTSGIWRPVVLQSWNKVIIRDLRFELQSLTNAKAEYRIALEVESEVAYPAAKAVIKVEGKKEQTVPVVLSEGKSIITVPLTIFDPKRWWCNGLGEPHLYNVLINLQASDVTLCNIEKRIGVRTIEIEQKPDQWGASFQVVLNGRPVFMKGTNYIPSRTLTTDVTPELYEAVLQNAITANMNMIRVWGGAIYENDCFYDRCDELGLLVWQDFMFACAMTPHSEDYVKNVRHEAEENVKRLRNHPCLALWCGNNENLTMLYQWGTLADAPKEWRQGLIDTYNRLYHVVLKAAVQKEDPGRFYWASSPQSSEGILANRQSGDDHDWSVWFGETPYENFNETYGRFVSEYGMQSLPDVRTLASFIPEMELDLHSPAMNNIQHSKMPWIAPDRNGNGQIEWYINNYYRKPKDFFATTYLSQLVQAETMRYAIELHRQSMPRCMGSLYWQINDCWPTVSWSSVDFYGRWKAAHYFAREAYKEVILSPHFYNDTLTVYAVNDAESFSGNLHLEWYNFKGKLLDSAVIPVELGENASTLCYRTSGTELLKKLNPKETVLVTTLKSGDTVIAENNCYLAKVKELELPPPQICCEITKKDDKYAIKLTSDVLAKNVYIETANNGFLSDNFFDLYPNRPATVTFAGKEAPQIVRVYSVTETF